MSDVRAGSPNPDSAPLISVVMPAFNSEKFIVESIRSVLEQSCRDFELIVVDDGSTDRTAQVVEGFAACDSRVRLFRFAVNQGPAAARNKAIEVAQGRFIAFLDADDLWTPEKLQRQIREMADHNWAFSYTTYKVVDRAGVTVGGSGRMRDSVNRHRLLGGCIIQNSTAIYDAEKIGKVFCPDLRRRQDFGLFLRILSRVDSAHLSKSSNDSCSYRQMSGTVSSRKLGNIKYQWQVYRKEERLNLLAASIYTILWLRYGSLKHLRRRVSAFRLNSE